MAAAPDPDEVLRSTRGKDNFQRLARLLISGGTALLREVFDKICPPINLPTILKNPATQNQLKGAKLTKPQWDCLYPSPGTYGTSAEFDVTLLFKLLRTICTLTPPATGWDALPASTDYSLEADLARIKFYRNSVYGHVNQNMEITDDEFPSLWVDITEALERIAGHISSVKKDEWEKSVNAFLKDPLTAEDERNAQELLRWYDNDTEVKKFIENLKTSNQEGMERLQEGLERAAHAIEKQGQLLENTFQKKDQDLKDQLTPIYENVQSLFQEQARDIKDKLDEVYQTIDGLQLLVREETQDMEGKLKTSIYENVQSLFREEARDIRDRLDEVYQTIDGLRLLVREESQDIKEKLETPIYENVQSLLREQARDIKDKLDEVYQTIDGLRSTIGSSQAAEGEGTGTTYNIDIHGGGPIAIGDRTNLYTEFPKAPARDAEDSDSIYDVPRVTSSNQHEQQQQQQQQEQHRHQQQQQQQPPQQRQHQKHQQQKQHQTEDTSKFNQSDGFILNNVEQLVNELDHTNGPQWQDKEQSILQGVETSLRAPCSNKMVVYQALAKMSCSRSSSKLVSYALRQLDCLMRSDNLESGKNNLLGVEKVLRFSISSPDAVFKDDGYPERKLRLSVYSRILALIIIQQTLQGKVFAVDLEAELLEFQDYLKKCYSQTKDCFRYSMEFIQKAISYLLRPNSDMMTSKVRSFLTECQENIKERSDECKEPSFIDMLKNRKVLTSVNKKKTKWLALHCVILYLQRKVHCSAKGNVDGRALSLLLRVIEAYRDGGGGNDWRFCFLASSVLSEIAMNTNVIKEDRIKAGECLVNLLKDKKVQKEQICRATVQGLSQPMLFCPDSSTRELLAPQLCYGENSCYILPEHLHTELLVTRQQVLQINTTISQSSRFFVKNGVFHGKKVAVKVLYVTNQSILENRLPECQQGEQRLIQEASFLARLNKLKQPNFPVLLSYNTESLPYHLITEYESLGNLLQLLQKSHKEHSFLPIAVLFGMLINITEALQFLHELKMVHRSVMADSVLVGNNYVCKLSGLHSVREITGKALNKTKESYEDRSLLLRWKAPEVLKERRYSTASDVWSFGILMYEMLTYGCYPYKHLFFDQDVYRHVAGGGILPRESCFEDDEYDLMKECWQWRRSERITLSMLTAKLRKMHSAMRTSGNEKPRPNPPTLEPHITKGLEDLKESVHCSQPGHFSDDSSYSITVEKDGLLVRETTKKGDKLHRKRLLALKHPNLAINFASETSHVPFLVIEMVSIATDLGNLKEYVLNGHCQEGTIVAFLSQISSAIHHLHEKHIVHGELRAEHIYVVQPNKVQIVRLGRCKFLVMRPDEETSKSCVEQGVMPPESTAWSAPEVILQGNYSHASDVWSFGVVAWEVFAAFTHDESSRDKTLPYADLTYDEILPSIQGSKLLSKPESCPDWIFIMIHQCWAYQPKQRPPAIALLDCLTARKPIKSWLMKLWLNNHCMEEWPDLSISQPEDACHVTNDEDHPREEDIKKMCSDGFFAEHEYQYVSVNSFSKTPVRDNKAITTDDYEFLSDVRPLPAPQSTGNEVTEAPAPLRPPRRLLPRSRSRSHSRPLPPPPPQP